MAHNYLILTLINFIGLVLANVLLDGVYMAGYGWALLAAALLTLLHLVLRPLLILFTLPFTIITMGLFLLVINGIIFWLAGSLLDGFRVEGFASAMGGAIIVSIVGVIANMFFLSRPGGKQRARVFTVHQGGASAGSNTFSSYRTSGDNKSGGAKRDDNGPHKPRVRPGNIRSAKADDRIIDMENDESGQWKIKD